MLNPEITAKLAEWDALFAEVDPHDWIRNGPKRIISAFDAYHALRNHIAAQAARIESLRTALRQTIVNMGGIAEADVSDEFLCHAAEESKVLKEMVAKLEVGGEAEFKRGWRQAWNEVAVSIDCDIAMYKGQLWADKIMALQDERESLASKVAELEQGINSANTAVAHHYEKLTANNEVYRVELDRLKRELAAAEERAEKAEALRATEADGVRVSMEVLLERPQNADIIGRPGSAFRSSANKIGDRLIEGDAIRSQLAAAQAQNAGLRSALEEVRGMVSFQIRRIESELTPSPSPVRKVDYIETLSMTYGGFGPMCSVLDTALTATPAVSLAMVKAGAVREFADHLGSIESYSCNFRFVEWVPDFIQEAQEYADQLESAAKGENHA